MNARLVGALLLGAACQANAADVNFVIDMVECESSGRHNVPGDGGKSYGIAQFQKRTFDWLKRLAGKPHFQYENPVHQLRLMVWAIDNGYGNEWTCYRKLKGTVK